VAHLSGAGEYIDQVFREMEEIRVLARDGTSADVLSTALLGVVSYVKIEKYFWATDWAVKEESEAI